jgi:hypothetical protein
MGILLMFAPILTMLGDSITSCDRPEMVTMVRMTIGFTLTFCGNSKERLMRTEDEDSQQGEPTLHGANLNQQNLVVVAQLNKCRFTNYRPPVGSPHECPLHVKT